MKTRRDFIQSIGLASLFTLSFGCRRTSNHNQKKPNVILIMTDDQGYGDLACHGNPYIQTPNLDELHSKSIRLTHFHVSPLCAPTRASLMTGRFSDRTQVRSTIQSRNHLNRKEVIMPEFFKASGYRTGLFGKWHLGRNYPYRPIDRGFDEWVGHGDGGTGTASDYWGNDKMNDTYYRNGKWEKFEGFCTDIYFNETMKFIEKSDEPFFVYLATNVPHRPWNIPSTWRQKYIDMDLSSDVIDFYATISRFDQNLGKLRRFLKERHLDDNTIIIYLTDNGTSGGADIFNDGMRGRKGSVYEGGHRVPCFIHWPAGDLNSPKDIDVLTSHVDLLPTLRELCELNDPERDHLPFDGKNLKSLFDSNPNWSDRTIYMHSQNTREIPQKWINSLVATEGWRMISGKELYDIKKDPGQTTNVADQYPDVMAELCERYEQYWDEIDLARDPYPRPIIGSTHEEETWLACDALILDDIRPMLWDQSHIRQGVVNFGFWPVEVHTTGTYRFDVRRWPKEVEKPLSAPLPKPKNSDIYRNGESVFPQPGQALPVAAVRLLVGKHDVSRPVNKTDTAASFDLQLPGGETRVQAWLLDQNNQPITTAYGVYVRRMDSGR